MRDGYWDMYESYCHYPIIKANDEFAASLDKVFRITTINWTFANGVKCSEVHKNTYIWTLEELLDWIEDPACVAESIIDIEPIDDKEQCERATLHL